jgi:hypothetical protein
MEFEMTKTTNKRKHQPQRVSQVTNVPQAVLSGPREVLPLATVLRQIRRDAHREPRKYLDETTVPFGGE